MSGAPPDQECPTAKTSKSRLVQIKLTGPSATLATSTQPPAQTLVQSNHTWQLIPSQRPVATRRQREKKRKIRAYKFDIVMGPVSCSHTRDIDLTACSLAMLSTQHVKKRNMNVPEFLQVIFREKLKNLRRVRPQLNWLLAAAVHKHSSDFAQLQTGSPQVAGKDVFCHSISYGSRINISKVASSRCLFPLDFLKLQHNEQ